MIGAPTDGPQRDDAATTAPSKTRGDSSLEPDDALEELLESVDVPGSGAKAADRRDAARETIAD